MISLCIFHMNVYQYLLIICNILFPGQIVRACTTVVHRIVNAHTALTSTAYVGVLQVICHKRSCLDNEFQGENKKLSSPPILLAPHSVWRTGEELCTVQTVQMVVKGAWLLSFSHPPCCSLSPSYLGVTVLYSGTVLRTPSCELFVPFM